uniref:Aldose 1-epimerase-like n=1 Tax=Rhizophora mucronata TaxID=61149 RepID=A0A2P2KSP6_RHIMU
MYLVLIVVFSRFFEGNLADVVLGFDSVEPYQVILSTLSYLRSVAIQWEILLWFIDRIFGLMLSSVELSWHSLNLSALFFLGPLLKIFHY